MRVTHDRRDDAHVSQLSEGPEVPSVEVGDQRTRFWTPRESTFHCLRPRYFRKGLRRPRCTVDGKGVGSRVPPKSIDWSVKEGDSKSRQRLKKGCVTRSFPSDLVYFARSVASYLPKTKVRMESGRRVPTNLLLRVIPGSFHGPYSRVGRDWKEALVVTKRKGFLLRLSAGTEDRVDDSKSGYSRQWELGLEGHDNMNHNVTIVN